MSGAFLYRCDQCGVEGAKSAFKHCAACREATYCSPECQRTHWKAGHKHKCVKQNRAGAPAAAAAAAPAAASRRPAAHAAAAPRSPALGGGDGEGGCAICLEALQQPQTMPCGHRFCRGCVGSMRLHGVTEVQLCPLCRGPMPDAERMFLEAEQLLAQVEKWRAAAPPGSRQQQQQQQQQQQHQQHAGARSEAWAQQQERRATAQLRAALDIDPASAPVHFAYAFQLNLGRPIRDRDGAIRHYQLAAQHAAHPYGNALYNLGVLLDERGDLPEAEAAYRAAVATGCAVVHAHALTNVGLLLAHRGDIDGAEAAYRAAIAADPRHVESRCNLGGVLGGERNDLQGALEMFESVLRIDPANGNARENVAIVGGLMVEEMARFRAWCRAEGKDLSQFPKPEGYESPTEEG